MTKHYPNFSDEYLQKITERFPFLKEKGKEDIIEALKKNSKRDEESYQKEFGTIVYDIEKDYYLEKLQNPEIQEKLSGLPRKQVPKDTLGNNYVVGVPGNNDEERKEYVASILAELGYDDLVEERNNLPHYKNVFLFILPENGGSIPPHHHEQEARLFILSGSAKDISNNIVEAGNRITNEPQEEHGYLTGKDECLIAVSRGKDEGILKFSSENGEFFEVEDFINT